MRTDAAPKPTLLADYTPPNFKVDSVYLDFNLEPEATLIKSKLHLTRQATGPLELDGDDIQLKSVKIDGRNLKRSEYKLTQTQLILNDLPDICTLEIETVCNPSANSTLMGLYVSGGRFCTQCEAEGFRRMTYYLDRPDVLSVFTVRIEADLDNYPFLLSNGNMIEEGALPEGKHYAIWEDPFPKPCYLFALVAGEFDTLEDSFTTKSGRDIPLTIYSDPGDAPKCEYAMDALKRSMKWDEEEYGREYDLDRFMIVAVRDFNFGAMENKGLNIFNSVLLLADEKTATDLNFERIESVVAHEYFHNWTGNRITCRDWFQLCLKEGFTVFRDQEFSASQRGATVQRIKDVRALRSRQFPEDAGPLAHPVRPSQFIKIDNFYTATVYEKGAELIRMLKILLGEKTFRKGCDLYFESLDGTAATVEQFIDCFEKISGKDLTDFMRWYNQAGTPKVKMVTNTATREVSFKQDGNRPVPVKLQAVYESEPVIDPELLILGSKTKTIKVDGSSDFTVSAFQDFSAPIILDAGYTTNDLVRLMRHDPNGFNRWEAGQTLARKLLCQTAKAIESGTIPDPDTSLKAYTTALRETLLDKDFDPAYKALVLTPPASAEILQSLEITDPIAIHLARNWLERAIGDDLEEDLAGFYNAMANQGAFSPSAPSAGRRALKNRCLSLLASRRDPQAAPLAISQFKSASNMTDEIAGLVTLSKLGGRRVDQSMLDFYNKWKDNPLVIDKWFMIVAGQDGKNSLQRIYNLTQHEAYTPNNPNRVRALLGGFAVNNPEAFHHISGQGYHFFTDQILDMDSRNPSVAARLLGLFETWPKYDKSRQKLIKEQLSRIISSKPSKNVLEIAQKTLG